MPIKIKSAAKRNNCDLDKDDDIHAKPVKMRLLESVIQSAGMSQTVPKTQAEIPDINTSQFTTTSKRLPNTNSDPVTGEEYLLPSQLQAQPRHLESFDLNVEVTEYSPCNKDANQTSMANSSQPNAKNISKAHPSTTRLDLIMEDLASSVNLNSILHDVPYKVDEASKSRDSWECGTTDPPETAASLRKWTEMKQHGFVSPCYTHAPHSSAHPPLPRPTGRKTKTKSDAVKRKMMEQARKEQADWFTKFDAPTGLLNGFNPGIINHVRNSKQVHSIIQALVRSQLQDQVEKGHGGRSKQSSSSQTNKQDGDVFSNSISMSTSKQTNYDKAQTMTVSDCVSSHEDNRLGYVDHSPYRPIQRQCKEGDPLALRLSSSTTMFSENVTTSSKQEPENVDSLSLKAADVASQWLQLLRKDIKGRLAALRRSKKRVQDVISTELPFLSTKHFSAAPRDCHDKEISKFHQIHWTKLFSQMEKVLSEEENQLEFRLTQLNKTQQLCEEGLRSTPRNEMLSLPLLGGSSVNDDRLGVGQSDGDLAVMAAAASIYSTCNFVSLINVDCR